MFFPFFFGEHKFSVELHGNLRPGTSLISMERVTYAHDNRLFAQFQFYANLAKAFTIK